MKLNFISQLLEAAEDKKLDTEELDDTEDTELDNNDADEDIGDVAAREGFAKSQSTLNAFGKSRKVTVLAKDEELGGLDLTIRYLINPETGAWKLQACLQGQSELDMVDFDAGEDPTSLLNNLKKKNRITAKQAIQNLKAPVD